MARRSSSRRVPQGLPEVGSKGDPQGLTTLAHAHLEWMRERNYSEQTISGRIKDLRDFLRWCSERGLARACEISRPMLERYQRHLFHWRKTNGQPLTVRSQRHRLDAVRALFRWLAKHNLVLANPASELELPRVPLALPKQLMSAKEIEQVLAACDVTTPLGVRDRAMLETLYSTGVRRFELAQLGVFDLDLSRETVMIRQGKGHKDRVAPIGPRAIAWVLKYLNDVRPSWVVEPDCGVLFLNHLGEPFDPGYLTHLVRGYVEAAGLGKRGSCHLFRHSVATLMLENGADIRFIQAFLGHARLETTQIYTQVSIRQLKEIHTATHPGEQRGAGGALEREESERQVAAEELQEALAAEAIEEAVDDAPIRASPR